MKPEDVMKALECCAINQSCDGCPMFGSTPEADCSYSVMSCALALIREKDAVIDRLYKNLNETAKEQYINGRADAITELADAVKLEFYREFDEIIPSIMADKIDQIAKELKGEQA